MKIFDSIKNSIKSSQEMKSVNISRSPSTFKTLYQQSLNQTQIPSDNNQRLAQTNHDKREKKSFYKKLSSQAQMQCLSDSYDLKIQNLKKIIEENKEKIELVQIQNMTLQAKCQQQQRSLMKKSNISNIDNKQNNFEKQMNESLRKKIEEQKYTIQQQEIAISQFKNELSELSNNCQSFMKQIETLEQDLQLQQYHSQGQEKQNNILIKEIEELKRNLQCKMLDQYLDASQINTSFNSINDSQTNSLQIEKVEIIQDYFKDLGNLLNKDLKNFQLQILNQNQNLFSNEFIQIQYQNSIFKDNQSTFLLVQFYIDSTKINCNQINVIYQGSNELSLWIKPKYIDINQQVSLQQDLVIQIKKIPFHIITQEIQFVYNNYKYHYQLFLPITILQFIEFSQIQNNFSEKWKSYPCLLESFRFVPNSLFELQKTNLQNAFNFFKIFHTKQDSIQKVIFDKKYCEHQVGCVYNNCTFLLKIINFESNYYQIQIAHDGKNKTIVQSVLQTLLFLLYL